MCFKRLTAPRAWISAWHKFVLLANGPTFSFELGIVRLNGVPLTNRTSCPSGVADGSKS